MPVAGSEIPRRAWSVPWRLTESGRVLETLSVGYTSEGRGGHMNLKIETRQVDGVTVVSCTGRIVFGEEATALRDQLKRTLSTSRSIVLNLAGVSYIDSGGLGTLVGVYSSARSQGADIKLTGLGPRVRDVLQITKLVTVFETYDSEPQAVAAFQRGAA